MEGLPDEIWRRILEMGVKNSKWSYKDLCCVSISSRCLNRLSNEDTLWSTLLTMDFPQSSHHDHQSSSQPLQSPYKTRYKLRFEREKERKIAVHRRDLRRIEGQISVYCRNLQELRHKLMEEREKMKVFVGELSNLETVRRASVAMNVWQPEIVRGRHKQIVEQCVVPIESRISAVQMELRVCKQQIEVFDRIYRSLKKSLDASKERLGLMKYHPLRDYKLAEKCIYQCKIQRKKLKLK